MRETVHLSVNDIDNMKYTLNDLNQIAYERIVLYETKVVLFVISDIYGMYIFT